VGYDSLVATLHAHEVAVKIRSLWYALVLWLWGHREYEYLRGPDGRLWWLNVRHVQGFLYAIPPLYDPNRPVLRLPGAFVPLGASVVRADRHYVPIEVVYRYSIERY
jgi:hypothetical protein